MAAPVLGAHAAADESALRLRIVERLGPSPLAEDQLIRDLGLPAQAVSPALMDLELEGRVIRLPGGRIALLDVSVPINGLVRWGNSIYFGKVVPRIGALLSDGPAYRYLPKSVAYLPTADDMLTALRAAGFGDATHTQLSGGLTQLMVGTRG